MRKAPGKAFAQALAATLLTGVLAFPAPAGARPFQFMDASITDVHQAMRAGTLSCHDLVRRYLDRIAAFDKQGPSLNAILYINPQALAQADAMDQAWHRTGRMAPLHCVPTILKDNYNTADMPTTGGSAALAGARPAQDATVVARLRQRGALILAKANMQEFALGGATVSSLGGQTRNPYDLSLTPGGSSGGTAAAVAANFAVVGTGSDTANSVRSPASANDLVGIRPTRGLISRAGIIPVSFTQDAAGPLTRSVGDAARMLDAMAGYDPADPVTALSTGHIPPSYTAFLDRNGLKGARIGVVQNLFGNSADDEPVNQVMARAIAILKKRGAIIVPVNVPALDSDKLNADLDVQKYEFKSSINAYLQAGGDAMPVHDLDQLVSSGRTHPSLKRFLITARSFRDGLAEDDYKNRMLRIDALKVTLANVLASQQLQALVYPHQRRLPVPIGEYNQTERNGIVTALTGFPSFSIPAGFSEPNGNAPIGVPVGMEFVGLPWSEPQLLRLAYGFEQAARQRRMPLATPPLAPRPAAHAVTAQSRESAQ